MNKIILFVSQDPGSGNALSPVIKKLLKDKGLNIEVFATKHSKTIFKQHNIHFKDMDNNDFNKEISFLPDLIITGASSGICIEKEAILFGKKRNIKTTSILDFWGNYGLRYHDIKNKVRFRYLPDYIFVMDEFAKDHMIDEGFPRDKLIMTGNPYFDTFKKEKIREIKKEIKPNHHIILYVSQPINEHGIYKTDFRTLKDFMSTILKLNNKINIIIRPHPKEVPKHYHNLTEKYSNVTIDYKTDIKDLIKKSSIIFGKHSMVLFESVFENKLVISYQPIKGKFDPLITNKLGLSYHTNSKKEVEELLKKAINNNLKPKKIGTLKYYNDGKCTERVVLQLYELLNEN